jgi:hypothetical protein
LWGCVCVGVCVSVYVLYKYHYKFKLGLPYYYVTFNVKSNIWVPGSIKLLSTSKTYGTTTIVCPPCHRRFVIINTITIIIITAAATATTTTTTTIMKNNRYSLQLKLSSIDNNEVTEFLLITIFNSLLYIYLHAILYDICISRVNHVKTSCLISYIYIYIYIYLKILSCQKHVSVRRNWSLKFIEMISYDEFDCQVQLIKLRQ